MVTYYDSVSQSFLSSFSVLSSFQFLSCFTVSLALVGLCHLLTTLLFRSYMHSSWQSMMLWMVPMAANDLITSWYVTSCFHLGPEVTSDATQTVYITSWISALSTRLAIQLLLCGCLFSHRISAGSIRVWRYSFPPAYVRALGDAPSGCGGCLWEE